MTHAVKMSMVIAKTIVKLTDFRAVLQFCAVASISILPRFMGLNLKLSLTKGSLGSEDGAGSRKTIG